jgi:hypothetical protein
MDIGEALVTKLMLNNLVRPRLSEFPPQKAVRPNLYPLSKLSAVVGWPAWSSSSAVVM